MVVKVWTSLPIPVGTVVVPAPSKVEIGGADDSDATQPAAGLPTSVVSDAVPGRIDGGPAGAISNE